MSKGFDKDKVPQKIGEGTSEKSDEVLIDFPRQINNTKDQPKH